MCIQNMNFVYFFCNLKFGILSIFKNLFHVYTSLADNAKTKCNFIVDICIWQNDFVVNVEG